jgi:hypothetical protein
LYKASLSLPKESLATPLLRVCFSSGNAKFQTLIVTGNEMFTPSLEVNFAVAL